MHLFVFIDVFVEQLQRLIIRIYMLMTVVNTITSCYTSSLLLPAGYALPRVNDSLLSLIFQEKTEGGLMDCLGS